MVYLKYIQLFKNVISSKHLGAFQVKVSERNESQTYTYIYQSDMRFDLPLLEKTLEIPVDHVLIKYNRAKLSKIQNISASFRVNDKSALFGFDIVKTGGVMKHMPDTVIKHCVAFDR